MASELERIAVLEEQIKTLRTQVVEMDRELDATKRTLARNGAMVTGAMVVGSGVMWVLMYAEKALRWVGTS